MYNPISIFSVEFFSTFCFASCIVFVLLLRMLWLIQWKHNAVIVTWYGHNRHCNCVELHSQQTNLTLTFTFYFSALNQMGYRLSPQFVQMIIFKYDIHARRCLTLDNFIQACVLLRSLTDSFRHKDTNMSGTIQISYDDFMCMTLLNK